MVSWRKIVFVIAGIGIITLSVALIFASYVELVTKEPLYLILMKMITLGIGILGLIVALLKIPPEHVR